MLAGVISPYTDKLTGRVRYVGDSVELDEDRFAELLRGGFVAPAEIPDVNDGVAEEGEELEPEEEPEEGPEEDLEPAPKPMTRAELAAAIEAKGGFAPKRATVSQLTEILETL